MKNANELELTCSKCQTLIPFSLSDLKKEKGVTLSCNHCSREYLFNDPTLQRQIEKFEALCHQLRDSEEILSDASIAVEVGEHRVDIPYKLLLSRLNSKLELNVGGTPTTLSFRWGG
jgi:hypothetical protein